MKYKLLTKEQILLSVDRLTRFKNTKDKYLRVYKDIIVSNLIEPKLSKKDIEKMDISEITSIVSEIFNAALGKNRDLTINKMLKKQENRVFINSNETQKLLDNDINYNALLEYIDENAPVNLLWLKNIIQQNSIKIREEKLLKYPLEKIILVEGITEEILLPAFSKFMEKDFYAKGVQIIGAGGKNQVVKKYYELINEVKLPIFILLDNDAQENIKQIQPKLRKIDRIHLVSCGEFEDLLPKTLIIKTVNSHFANFSEVSEKDFDNECSTVNILENLYKTKGLHEFKKAEFAKLVKEKISEYSDISTEIKEIITEIFA
ncbi:MAG: ATP-dependent endonuclease [bacterium]|nr:ATP-dependent endonuclease [bacterium]